MFRDRAPEGFRISVLNFKWISTAGTHIHTCRLSIAPAVRCRCKDTEFRPERDVFLPSTRRASQRMRQQQLEVVEIYCWHRLPPQACVRLCPRGKDSAVSLKIPLPNGIKTVCDFVADGGSQSTPAVVG